jgi:hypothetical protein
MSKPCPDCSPCDFTCWNKMEWHRPCFYRYEVSTVVRRRLPRLGLNRYPGVVIGAALVVGRHAYCVKWGSPR